MDYANRHDRELAGVFDWDLAGPGDWRFDLVMLAFGCRLQPAACDPGALDLVTACDIRLCTADAFFTLQEIQIGMMADVGVIQRLSKFVPQGVVRALAYTGEKLGAERDCARVAALRAEWDSRPVKAAPRAR